MFKPGAAPGKPVSSTRLAELLEHFPSITDLNMPGLHLNAMRMDKRSFHGCNFSGATLEDCEITECHFEMCFFDFSTHIRSRYSGLTVRNSVFACSNFEDISFVGCNLIQCSFNSLTGSVLFDDCDLLHSRFNCSAGKITVNNCNVKETHFLRTPRELLDFQYANEEDALFADPDGWE